MCGIVAYTGAVSGTQIVLDGLSKLEYRGYDSAGIAGIVEGRIAIERTAGKLSRLAQKVHSRSFPAHTIIGHTRWATHGRPTEINAHPHVSGKTALVHNGIVENYLELRQELIEKHGFQFLSDTDSEVIAHLISRHYAGEMLPALRDALKEIEGSFALAIIHEDHPGKVFLARRSSPLVAAVSEDAAFAASDIPALLAHTRSFTYLEDGDIALIEPGKLSIFDAGLNPITRTVHRVDWSPSMAEKGGFRHFMQKEIHEQDRAVEDTLRGRINRSASDVMLFPGDSEFFSGIDKFFIVACGTSWHAALTAKFYIENIARVPAEVDLASEFRYRSPILRGHDAVILISQSGETADTLAALRMAKEMQVPTIAVCNVVGSTMAREADQALFTYAGPEIGVASTKAFTTQLAMMYLIALKAGIARNSLDKAEIKRHIRSLSELPDLIKQTLQREKAVSRLAREFQASHDFLFIGRGITYPIALEGALKLKEISYIHAEGYPAGELKHGPLALVDEHMPVVAVMPDDTMHQKMFSNVKEVSARDGIIIAIHAEGLANVEDVSSHHIALPRCSEWQAPILYVVPLQMLAYFVAVNKGTDVDQPRNLAKSVTVE